ncbi:zincin-like metallopeptidase domain-containing protein, partial [Sphingobium boeckii]
DDYAELEARDHAADRANSTPRGIIRVAALWVLCRYRHKTHWTGSYKRLDRPQNKRGGEGWYAREELVAEMTTAFVCARLGIAPTVRHADYLGLWLQELREDHRAIFKAASQASKAADYILAFAQHGARGDE